MASVNINRATFLAAATKSPGYDAYGRSRCEVLQKTATSVFQAKQRHDNEWRTSETTPPKYLASWKILRVGNTFLLVNRDPAALWVEYGAHAGGETRVLGYKPLTTALEIVAGEVARDQGRGEIRR